MHFTVCNNISRAIHFAMPMGGLEHVVRWANPGACQTLSSNHISNQLPVYCYLFQMWFALSAREGQTAAS